MQAKRLIASTLLLIAPALGGCDTADELDHRAPHLDDPALDLENEDSPETAYALTEDEVAEIQRERRAASLPLLGGRVDIVDAGIDGEASFIYVTVGDSTLLEVLDQLVEAQEATPAEVFLALAEDSAELPLALAEDHRAKVEAGVAARTTPEKLHYIAPRTLERETLSCHNGSGSAQSFATWTTDWELHFGSVYASNEAYDQNTADGTDFYTVAGDTHGRALSACNASHNDPLISYWVYNPGAGPAFTPFWAETIDRFEAVHFYSAGWGLPYQMAVTHNHPSPNTYVAFGRCSGGC